LNLVITENTAINQKTVLKSTSDMTVQILFDFISKILRRICVIYFYYDFLLALNTYRAGLRDIRTLISA